MNTSTVDAPVKDQAKRKAKGSRRQSAAKSIAISTAELEVLLRRVVREVVHEELAKVVPPRVSILDDWSHEGPDDPEGDEEALQAALATLEKYKDDRTGWMSLEEFKHTLAEEEKISVVLR